MKFLLLDDHLLFLEGLKSILLKQFTDAEIFTANQVDIAIQIIDKNKDIDLVLVDLSMPDSGGLMFIQHLQKNALLIPSVVLSASENVKQIKACLDAGAQGFIPKYYDVPAMLSAILEINSGTVYLPDAIRHQINQQHGESLNNTTQTFDVTPRQLEVMSLINKGFANHKIASILYISEHTVKSHLKLIFKTMNVSNRVECIHKAKDFGLL